MAATAGAQDPRGSITGRVTDSSGGRMPGATVTATNIETNVPSATTTNGEGDYSILYLTPGLYTLSVELSGFKKMSREGLQVRIGDRLAVDGVLEVGRMEETVTVTAESPLLDTRSGSAGQVIDEKRTRCCRCRTAIRSRSPDRAGGRLHGATEVQPSFDNGGTSGIVADGSAGGQRNPPSTGSPNIADGRRVAFVPPGRGRCQSSRWDDELRCAAGHDGGRQHQRCDEERHQTC